MSSIRTLETLTTKVTEIAPVKAAVKAADVAPDPAPVPELGAGAIKYHRVYHLDTTIQSSYGYVANPGDLFVESAPVLKGGLLSVFNLTTGKKEMVYPCPASLPLVDVTNAERIKEQMDKAIAHAPGSFAALGANFHLGTDPEVFAVDAEGTVIPAYTFLGTQQDSAKAGLQSSGYHHRSHSIPYWDGYQGEFTVQPYSCIAHLTDCIRGGLDALNKAVRKHDPKARIVATPVLPIPAEVLASAKLEHVELGCLPSVNVYNDTGIHVHNGRDLPIRFAGFHLHFTVEKSQRAHIPAYVRMMDKLCGVMSVSVLQGMEDSIRRRYYGLAGEHRLPTHGLEWRTLSSAVLWHPAMVHLHFNMSRAALQLAEAGLERVWEGSDEEAREVVNTLDIPRAQAILERNRDLYVGVIKDSYCITDTANAVAALEQILLPGVMKHIELDMTKNWHLGREWKDHSNSHNCQFQDLLHTVLKIPKTRAL